MPFITFMYKIGRNQRIFYGKFFADYISDDHDGLDNEVRYYLLRTINRYRQNKNSNIKLNPIKNENLKIGVISFSSHNFIPDNSSDEEIYFFDYYKDYDDKEYITGSRILVI